MPFFDRPLRGVFLWLAGACLPMSGCVGRAENEVVVYAALDEEFSAPILDSFRRAEGGRIVPAARYDVESTKTVGLVNRILAEQERPVCDVFWNNEILHTVRLQKRGLLRKHRWPIDPDWPSWAVASDGTWCGFAARARVLLINTELLPDPDHWPRSILELGDPQWKDRCALARPLFGTTATHAAVLDVALGSEAAGEFFRSAASNAVVLSGNKQVALAVSSGQVAWGWTDTDDAIIERDQRHPVAIVYPDQQPAQLGTLLIPNTVAILRDAPHPRAAAQLADFLVSPATEERLAMGDSAQIPLFREVEVTPRVLPDEPVRWMEADFEAAADRWESLAEELQAIFTPGG